MLIIKDAMVIIHLAKLSILEKSCEYFKKVLIPEEVHKEVVSGKEKASPEIPVVMGLINNKKIMVKKIKDQKFIEKANQFNIQGGEAEAVALYWQEKADVIATDDDNVRKKKAVLNINVIGTPVILVKLHKKKMIDDDKAKQCIFELGKIGWFSNTILDKILMEVENGGGNRH